MTFDPHESNLTAYALDELSGEEKQRISDDIAHSPEKQQWVEDVQWMASFLKQELQQEPAPQLQDSQRAALNLAVSESQDSQHAALNLTASASQEPAIGEPVEAESEQPVATSGYSVPRWMGWMAATLAVAFVLGGTSLYMFSTGQPTPNSLSMPANVQQRKPQARINWQKLEKQRQYRNPGTVTTPPQSNEKEPSPTKSLDLALKSVKDIPPPRGRTRPTNINALVLSHLQKQGYVSANSDGDRKPRAQKAEDGVRWKRDQNVDSRESYAGVQDNPFYQVSQRPLSTFSIDVDTASYSNIRRFLNHHTTPPKDAVRIEEMVNYFAYNYAPPKGSKPFAARVEVASAPWNPAHRLVRIGLKGKVITQQQRPASNLVFLLDVSCSMQPANKLPLLKRAFKLLVRQLGEKDRVAIVVYAGAAGLVLPATSGDNQQRILAALNRLSSGGSTNGGAGIQLAYQIAVQNFIKGGINRVILATDGDFNVGVQSRSKLTRLIQRKARSGVFLTVLGFGMGNYKDSTLERLANKGNGNYAYIDNYREAKKVFVQQLQGNLITIAKDVKIQVEFNPAKVQSYRLIGYENRKLRNRDFHDDKIDAGEIGAGHTVTAFYEVVPVKNQKSAGTQLHYQKPSLTKAADSGELLTLKLRYKKPSEQRSKLLTFPIVDQGKTFARSSKDFQFATAVAAFGMLLRNSPHKGNATFANVLEIAQSSKGADRYGHRAEFIGLVQKAQALYQE